MDAKPTIEALEAERLRLKELERNLARERNRVQESAAREVARMHAVLRESAERAGKRERELEKAHRKAEGGRVGRLALTRGRRADARVEKDYTQRERELAERALALDDRERAVSAASTEIANEASRLNELEAMLAETAREVELGESLAARAAELEAREAELERKIEELVAAESESARLLAARTAEIEARATETQRGRGAETERRAAELAALAAALEVRERKLEKRADEVDQERAPDAEPAAVIPVPVTPDLKAEQTAAVVEGEQRAGEVERRAAELDDQATLLEARESELAESLSALEGREREVARMRDELEAERRRLAARARRLSEAERRAPVRTAGPAEVVSFSEGLRSLSRKRAG